MNYRDPKESQSIFETRTLQTQCRWKVIAYGVKPTGFPRFSPACGACSDLQTVPPLRADIALRNADPLFTGKNDPKMIVFCP